MRRPRSLEISEKSQRTDEDSRKTAEVAEVTGDPRGGREVVTALQQRVADLVGDQTGPDWTEDRVGFVGCKNCIKT